MLGWCHEEGYAQAEDDLMKRAVTWGYPPPPLCGVG